MTISSPGKQQGGNENTHADGAERQLLTVEQAAQYLQLSSSSIRSYIRQGKLKAFRVAGLRKVLIARTELLALLEPTATSCIPTARALPLSSSKEPLG